jgi:hypothetical protein
VTKDTKELGIQKHANILKHPIFILIPIALILTIYFAVNSGIAKSSIVKTVKQSAFAGNEKKESVSSKNVKAPVVAKIEKEPVTRKKSFEDQYALVGLIADKIALEDRVNGQQRSLFEVIGGYTIIDSKRNEYVTVTSNKGEIFTFKMGSRYRPAATEQTARSLAGAAG